MTHDLLTGDEDPPGEWEDAIIGGGYISFRHPTDADDEKHYVVIQIGGDHDDPEEERPVEVWTVDMPDSRILMNYRDSGEVIGTGVGISTGAEMALEYMRGER